MPVTINGTTGIAGVDGSAGTPAIQGSDTNTGIFFPAADTIAFGEGGSEILRINSSGNVVITNPNSLLGYGTGSGGTVTQATNKSTAVTLNKPTGQITMNNAALASNASVAFALNNSLITASDILLVNVNGSGITSLGSYNLWTQASAGVGYIAVRNISGGSLSEAIVINFAVIKGATS
jgi:hypothetical protein